MLTREDVVYAYRLFFGREPESEEAIEGHLRTLPDVEALRRRFLQSDEFRETLGRQAGYGGLQIGRHYRGAPIAVQLDGPDDQLRRMFARTAEVWSGLGRTEPHWSVLTDPRFTAANIAHTEREFYATGAASRDILLAFFARNGIEPDPAWRAMELGCGAGRISWALAQTFGHVTGLDVSPPHIGLAERYCAAQGIRNVDFRCMTRIEDFETLPRADVFFSLIILQHNPPPIIQAVLRALLSRVEPGGYAFFQVPTYVSGYRFAWETYLDQGAEGMEMHPLPQAAVHRLKPN